MKTLAININKQLKEKINATAGDIKPFIKHFEQVAKGTLMEHLPIKLRDVKEDYIEATMLIDERSCQTQGCLHGGASMAIGESLGGYGSFLLLEEGQFPVGLQISGNHLSMAKKGDTIRALAQLIHHGRTTHLWQIDLYSQETGKLVSSVRLTNSIITAR